VSLGQTSCRLGCVGEFLIVGMVLKPRGHQRASSGIPIWVVEAPRSSAETIRSPDRVYRYVSHPSRECQWQVRHNRSTEVLDAFKPPRSRRSLQGTMWRPVVIYRPRTISSPLFATSAQDPGHQAHPTTPRRIDQTDPGVRLPDMVEFRFKFSDFRLSLDSRDSRP
jgi:hypothetical protein